MTTMQLAGKVNEIQNPVYLIHGLQVRVRIIDVRQVFDRIDYQIVPVNGWGETWVAESMVTGSHY